MSLIFEEHIYIDSIKEKTTNNGIDINGVLIKNNKIDYLNNVQNIKNNFNALSSPLNTDDSSSGYSVGSIWIFNNKAYICLDNTINAAIWKEISEVNNASNVGTSGIGIFKQKNGEILEFKKLNNLSNKISITDNIDNIDFDIALNAFESTSTTNFVVTSGTYVLVDGMSLSPGAGTYVAFFSTYARLPYINLLYAVFRIEIFDGVSTYTPISHSRRRLYGLTNNNTINMNVHSIGKITISSTDSVVVRVKLSTGGNTLRIYKRSLTLIKISN